MASTGALATATAVTIASVASAPEKVPLQKAAPKSKMPQKKRPAKHGPKSRAGQRVKLLRKRLLKGKKKAVFQLGEEDDRSGIDADDIAEVGVEEGEDDVVELVSALSEDDFSDQIDEEDSSNDDDEDAEGTQSWKNVVTNAIVTSFASIQGQGKLHIPRKRNRRHRDDDFDDDAGSSGEGMHNHLWVESASCRFFTPF
jgi:hypothetical protein